MIKKNFQFVNFRSIIVNTKYFKILEESSFLEKLLSFEKLENFFPVFFSHQKHYRKVKGFQVNALKIYVKKYLDYFEEAKAEWKNIQLLWNKGFPTSEPIFFFERDSLILVGTKAIPGRQCLEIIKKEPQKTFEIVKKIAKFLGHFHKTNLFHQDCYFNHFYLNEVTDVLYIIDVSRVLNNPLFAFYYQIKDLAQLKFSFFVYLEENWLEVWENFFASYCLHFKPLNFLTKMGINFKFCKIKKHTEKLYGSQKTY